MEEESQKAVECPDNREKQGKNETKGLTLKQERVVDMVANGRMNKAEVLRESGYSEAIIRHPERVFGSSMVRAAIEERARKAGLSEEYGFQYLKAVGKIRILKTDYFPSEEESGISDNEIRKVFGKTGFKVLFIVPTKKGGRVVKYTTQDWRILKEAAHMIFKIFGTYAPKKVEGKHMVRSSTLSDLRKWRRENNESPI